MSRLLKTGCMIVFDDVFKIPVWTYCVVKCVSQWQDFK